MVLIFFENFENFSYGAFYRLKKYPFKGQLSLAGNAQRSVPGDLRIPGKILYGEIS